MLKIIFIGSLFYVFYSYFGYPISIYLLGIFRNKDVERKIQFPYVTMIITAYNEEKRIKTKMENTLKIVYPKEKLQIIIASDGSTDCTNKFAEEL